MKPEELENLEEDIKEDSKFVKILKRTYIIIIALFLAMLLMVNSNTGYHIVSLFSGKIVSSSLNDDYSFDLKFGGKVFFYEQVYEQIKTTYELNKKQEFKLCLTGYREEKDYFVTGAYMPFIFEQDVYSVTSMMCNNETIISMHSHPPLRCIFSEQDIISYNRFKEINPEAIIGLMCGEERMSFFGYNQ